MGAAESENGVSPFVMSDADIVNLIKASYANLRKNGKVSQVTGQGETMVRKKMSENRLTKQTVEKGFGGIWLDNSVELHNFTSVARSQGYFENENYVYAGGNFYLYYVNSEYDLVPYVANRSEPREQRNYRISKNYH